MDTIPKPRLVKIFFAPNYGVNFDNARGLLSRRGPILTAPSYGGELSLIVLLSPK